MNLPWPTVADLVAIAVALWFLFAPRFDDLVNPLTGALAGFVVLSSLWRIWKRHGSAS
ncbi:hypothetical protein [uncultured Jannaschia sp.]|uniref:hypothetical protein n=1 Tax=uncultured Jannaschia sp. TaxID=293347 RepID=UPI002601D9AE|nr:hypothetical protein [uncultured Jannaschia sp.]